LALAGGVLAAADDVPRAPVVALTLVRPRTPAPAAQLPKPEPTLLKEAA